ASQSDYPDFYAEVRDFKPHIVISALDYRIFQIWEALDADAWRPYFLFSPRNIGEVEAVGFTNKLKGAINKGQGYMLERALGVSAAGSEDADLLNEYRKRLFKLAANLGVSVEPGENYYDAIYYLAYAMVGATGADTPPGSQIGHVGMNDIMLGSQ